MAINEEHKQSTAERGYGAIPFETDQLYKKYFVNVDLESLEANHTKDELLSDYDENVVERIHKKTGIKFDAVIHNGVIARGSDIVKTGGNEQKKSVMNNLPSDKFSAFAYDFCVEPISIEVKENSDGINILFFNSGKMHSPASVSVSVGEGVKATVNEYYFSNDVSVNSLSGSAQFFEIKDRARLEFNEIHCESAKTISLVTRAFKTYDESVLDFNAFYTGGASSRQRTVFRNDGENSVIRANEAIIGTNSQKFDLNTNLTNMKAKSKCIYEVRAVLADSANGIVKSFAKIVKGAEEAESHIKERGLIYDKGAKITMMPDMSIDESYVKASHSSSTSPISEDDIFYISNRGISKDNAKFLVGSGLIYELLKNIRSQDAKAFSMLMARHRLETREIGIPEALGSYGVWYD
ncbi:MAG: SufD family Fe-S cluster assembly protein [Candidatus Marsarchaeota archaeon]|nr:SufD family Fe-S cluster assembly protein [Candidatus Marsarchaeota archaeon]